MSVNHSTRAIPFWHYIMRVSFSDSLKALSLATTSPGSSHLPLAEYLPQAKQIKERPIFHCPHSLLTRSSVKASRAVSKTGQRTPGHLMRL